MHWDMIHKDFLFLHAQWFLERLGMMFRSYLFLVKWIARGFFWQWLFTIPWQRIICRKCARSWDFIHKMLQNEFSWGGSCSLLVSVIFTAQHTENTPLSRAESHCRLSTTTITPVNFTLLGVLTSAAPREVGQCVTSAAAREAPIYLSKSQCHFEEIFSLKAFWQAFYRWLKLYIQYFVHVPTRKSTNMIIHWNKPTMINWVD